MNTTTPKPGYLTTEFYAMLLNTALSICVVFGWLGPDDMTDITQVGIPFITATLGVIAYVLSRMNIKRAALLNNRQS